MAPIPETQQEAEYLSPEQVRALFEERVARYLGMTAQEFIERWDAGCIEDPDRPEIIRLSMLLPFVR